MAIKIDCIQKGLETLFYKYGKFVSRHPLPFLVVPIVITLGITLGTINLNKVDDMEYLYAPLNGQSRIDRSLFKKTFPENDSFYYNANRKSEINGFCQIIITDKNGGNIYTESHMDSVIQFNNDIINFKFSSGDREIFYNDVCSMWKGQCIENNWLKILNGSANTIITSKISYPLHNQMFIGFQLGGVELDLNGQVKSAKALFLAYDVRYITPEDAVLSKEWSNEISAYLSQYQSDNINVDYFLTESLQTAIDSSLSNIIPKFAIAFTVLITFCVLTCLMLDWVRSKTLVAFGGVVAAGMAILTTLGLLSATGLGFASTVGIMPFLIIGIGVDDMFVMLSSWRHTSVALSVEERMGLMFKTAAISITVTSVTDALAFLVGSLSDFRAVTLLCAWTGVAVIFSYIYAITFLAAVFVYSGRREASNRHEATFKKIEPTKLAEGKSTVYKFFCTGGDVVENEYSTNNNDEYIVLPWFTTFIRDTVAPFMMKTPIKVITMILYCGYLGVSIYGILQIKEGLQLQNLAPDGSHVIPFYVKLREYFNSKYGYPVMFAYTDTLEYSNPVVQQKIFSQVETIRQHKLYYNESIYYEFWLPNYISYLQMTSQPIPTDMPTFINILRSQFLQIPQFERFTSDIIFNADYSEITASRFLLQSKGVLTALEERELMVESRKLSNEAEYNLTPFYPLFIFFDQYTVIVSNVGQNIGIALASMLLVALLLLPSIISAIWVTVSVISILIGTIGFMVLWDVSLDSISMVNIILCIGYSVDFSAHISYQFCISKESTGNRRAIDTLSHLGTPIIQATVSTILGAIVLSTSGSYIARTFFKLIVMVMLFGMFHAMFILPVVLSVIGPQTCDRKKNGDTNEKSRAYIYNERTSNLYMNDNFNGVTNWSVVQNGIPRNQIKEKAPYVTKVYVVP